MTTDNAWQDEERIQAQRIADAIHKLIADDALAIMAEGRMPILNAVARALVTVEATMLASIVDQRKREALQDAMQRSAPRLRRRNETRCRQVGRNRFPSPKAMRRRVLQALNAGALPSAVTWLAVDKIT